MSDLFKPTLFNPFYPLTQESGLENSLDFQCHGGNLYAFARRLRIAPEEVLDFSASINPFGPPHEIMAIFHQEISFLLKHYPDPFSTEFRKKLSQRWNLPLESFIAGNGANELIPLIIKAIAPKRIHVPVPNFSSYFNACVSVVTSPFFDERGVKKDWLFKLLSGIEKDELVILSNPNNPTGILLTPKEKSLLWEVCQKERCWVLVDEAFLDFVMNEEKESFIPLISENIPLVVLRSMTKFYAIPGLRLGYIAGPPSLLSRVQEKKDPWSVNGLAQRVGIDLLALEDFGVLSRRGIEEEKRVLMAKLQDFSWLEVYPSAANYLLIRLKEPLTADKLQHHLKPFRILIRNCASFQGLSCQWVRVAVRTRQENEELVESFKRFQL